MTKYYIDSNIYDIAERIESGHRLGAAEGRRLFETQDILGLGALADRVRRARHGQDAFFVYNQHINYTNVCCNRCRFCAFARDRDENGAFTLTPSDVREALLSRIAEPITEIHMVGGINPALPFAYYLELLHTIREIRPQATIKAFTAVEIDHMARISGKNLTETVRELKSAGLGMMPGGGAEVLSARIGTELFPKKITADRWLGVMRTVHEEGLVANATLLYGHIETIEERVDHLLALRALQDETGGFSAFIPLAFHSQNTRLAHLPPTTGFDDLKTIAAARLILDNFDHIKAYWVMIGMPLAQVALSFGADDLDGTIVEEKITHMAGATSPKGMSREDMVRHIRRAGLHPVERDSFYRPVPSQEGPLGQERPT